MSAEIAVIFSFLLIIFIVLVVLKNWLNDLKKGSNLSGELVEWLKSTNKRLDDQSQHITATLEHSTKAFNERLDNAARIISALQKNIGEVGEIASSMKKLSEVLQSPKLRGNIGEQVLKELLSQMLPKQSFHLQFAFKSGETVDAAIKTANGIIPIDSKFPLNNFRKMLEGHESEKKAAEKNFTADVKKHIETIAKKYILPEEGTFDYALMYVPSEAVYYEIVQREELFEFSNQKRVLPVSPMTFYAYLKAILMSFEGQKIELTIRQLMGVIRSLQKDYLTLSENLSLLNKHINNAANQMSNVQTSFVLMGRKIEKTQFLSERKDN